MEGIRPQCKAKSKSSMGAGMQEKKEGGLGIINIRTQNEALLIKQLSKFFNKASLPWVSLIWERYYDNGQLPVMGKKGSFWWKDLLKLLDKFKGLAKVQINNGTSCFLWKDLWADEVLNQKFPELHSFAINNNITYSKAISANQLTNLFHLPISQIAHQQLHNLQNILAVTQVSEQNDNWSFIWSTQNFSVKKAYKHLSGHLSIHPAFNWTWSSSCQNKHKVSSG
jgi:hypothetical protein